MLILSASNSYQSRVRYKPSTEPQSAGAAPRPVGKRGVQSGIFEDEQELLPRTAPEPTPGPRREANTTVWESL